MLLIVSEIPISLDVIITLGTWTIAWLWFTTWVETDLCQIFMVVMNSEINEIDLKALFFRILKTSVKV